MRDECFREDDLEEILDLPEDHPRLAHAADCPACRALLLSHRAFRKPEEGASAEEREDAGRRLARFLGRETAAPAGAPPLRRARAPRGRLRTLLAAAAALAAVILLVPLFRGDGGDRPPVSGVLREESGGARLSGDARILPTGLAELTWNPSDSADSYQVVLYGAGQEEIHRFDAAGTTRITFDPKEFRPTGGSKVLLYRVFALRDRDEITRSDLRALPVE